MNAVDQPLLSTSPRFLEAREWSAILSSLQVGKRESEMITGIIACESEAELAARLGISTHTVHTYVDRLYRRLGVRSRCELVVRVFEVYVNACRAGGPVTSATESTTPS